MDMTTLCTLLLFWALLFGQSSCFTIIRVSGFSTSKLYHTKIISWNLGDVKYRQLFSAIRDEMCCPDDMTEHEEPIVSSHSVGGNIVVSGLSDNEEFTLSLLNNQGIWRRVTWLTKDDATTATKRLMSRSARYSGLLNVLDIRQCDLQDDDPVKQREVLRHNLIGANAWLAYNVPQDNIVAWADIAISANISRVIFTTTVDENQYNSNQTELPAFEIVKEKFQNQADSPKYFTGIRHGLIVPGEDDLPYYISNSSTKCLEPMVSSGVLSRVTTELLNIDASFNQECGLSGADSKISAEYLRGLRSMGLSRQEEVYKMFTGGIDRMVTRILEEEDENADDDDDDLEDLPQIRDNVNDDENNNEDEERIFNRIDPDTIFQNKKEEFITKRATEILTNVWKVYQWRMIARSTSEHVFFEKNKEKARTLAEREYTTILAKRMDKKAKLGNKIDRYFNRIKEQYQHLMVLEGKEICVQKDEAFAWIGFIYIILSEINVRCRDDFTKFLSMPVASQTALLMTIVNDLRKELKLPRAALIWDLSLAHAAVTSLGAKYWSSLADAQTLLFGLRSKYGEMVDSSPVMKTPRDIVQYYSTTVQVEIPSVSSVDEMKKSELYGIALSMKQI